MAIFPNLGIIEHYPALQGSSIEFLEIGGGLSGAKLWKLASDLYGDQKFYCLRRWPLQHPSLDQLNWIHRVLIFASENDCHFVPRPLLSVARESMVQQQGYLWEITPWMPGTADYHWIRQPIKMANMMEALAKFHLVVAGLQSQFRPSSNVQRRLNQLQSLPQLIQQLKSCALDSGISLQVAPEFLDRLRQLLRQFQQHGLGLALQLLQRGSTPHSPAAGVMFDPWAGQSYCVQPVIRDIWWDHCLFSGDELTGLIDYGAMGTDVVSFDLARLLGSCLDRTPADLLMWEEALAAYQRVRPLTEAERLLIPWIDATGVLLGVSNWLRWLFLEHRSFQDWQVVAGRIDHLQRRLGTLLQHGSQSV